MPVKKMSEKRRREVFGNGVILSGYTNRNTDDEKSKPLDLQNLPFDPAAEARKASSKAIDEGNFLENISNEEMEAVRRVMKVLRKQLDLKD